MSNEMAELERLLKQLAVRSFSDANEVVCFPKKPRDEYNRTNPRAQPLKGNPQTRGGGVHRELYTSETGLALRKPIGFIKIAGSDHVTEVVGEAVYEILWEQFWQRGGLPANLDQYYSQTKMHVLQSMGDVMKSLSEGSADVDFGQVDGAIDRAIGQFENELETVYEK